MVVYQWPDGRFDFAQKDSFFAAESRWLHAHYADYHMMLGLPFLHRLFAADMTNQKKLVLTNLNRLHQSVGNILIAQAQLSSSSDDGSDISTQSENLPMAVVDDARYPNAIWAWQRPDDDFPGMYRHGEWIVCQNSGYVFWDRARLELSEARFGT